MDTVEMSRQARTDLRRIVLVVTIASFSIAALMGIGALLAPGEFGETGVKVLLTTVVVGCASVVTLCCLTVVGGRFQVVGVTGFLVAVATGGLGLFLVWDWSGDLPGSVYKTFGVAVTVALTLAQISLLLGLAGLRRTLAPWMWSTVALALVVAALVSRMITGHEPTDSYLRTLGVVAILDVLGTLVTIAIGVFGRDDEALSVTLPPAVASRVRAASAESGRPVRDLVDEALTRCYGASVD
jgi:hypothetical protein